MSRLREILALVAAYKRSLLTNFFVQHLECCLFAIHLPSGGPVFIRALPCGW